jgi:deazaflavin-dependent oxidoreductase (nitroreductase family)
MPASLSPEVKRALDRDKVIDITTTGARSGRARTTEIWFYRLGDRIYITGSPGRRDWYANLLAHPAFIFRLKQSLQADLPAHAIPITAPTERRRVMSQIMGPDYDREKLEAHVEGSRLVEVVFD